MVRSTLSVIVIDAKIGLAQLLPLPYSPAVNRQMQIWSRYKNRLVVPTLWWYEIAAGLRKAIVMGAINLTKANEALEQVASMGLEELVPSKKISQLALAWAEQIRQSNTYDAQYLAMAEYIGAEFWTADAALAEAARQTGAAWVHWVGETLGKKGA